MAHSKSILRHDKVITISVIVITLQEAIYSQITRDVDLEKFLEDPRTYRAVAFKFTTVGEAARAAPADVQKCYPGVPWEKMQAIRNVLVHEYFRIDEEILWRASIV